MPATRIEFDQPLIKDFPLIYERGEPTAVLVDINVFELLLKKLEELENRELFGDPKIVARLKQARQDHLAGRVTPHAELIRELGLESEL